MSLAAVAGCGAASSESGSQAQVRVAHLSPDAPAVDFCVAPHGSGKFTGPILNTNGMAAGIAYASVTKYFQLDAEQYDVRLVAPGSADCATPLGGLADFTSLPDIPPGASITIAAEGLAAIGSATPLTLHAYVDDSSVDAGKAKLRFVHASPGTPDVDVGTSGGALFQPLFTDIAYGNTATADSGYIETDPLPGIEISARAHGTLTDALSITPAVLPAGAIATAFAIGEIGDASAPLRVLLCDDNAAPTGLIAQCSIVGGTPSRAHVRVAHLSPDLRAVDICLAAQGTMQFSPPVLAGLGVQDGLTYAAVTAYVDLPVGSYDVRVILANASGCSIPAIPDTDGVRVDNNETVSVLALGDFDTSGAAAHDPALHLAVFNDATAAPNGDAKLRFIHASPGTPAVDVGLGSGAAFTKVFADVSFGDIATNQPIDALGFATTAAPVTSAVSARLAGANSDALTIPSVTLPAQGVFTAFAIGGKTGASDNPLQVLLCDDNAAPNGLLAACAVAN
ncbi:MAG TPA: DUF4397 domain-containing protein [Kofleriaceae bacterium]|nr:DUF4397 domain-containing protein [Kofleriaceae bacterium]